MKRTQMLERFCSGSALLLSLLCCIAWINVELRIQEHHRLISHSAKFCDKIETEITRKMQKNYARWQLENIRKEEDGKFAVIAVIYSQSVTPMFHAYFCLGDSAFDTLQSKEKNYS